jgi:hypothetical protein
LFARCDLASDLEGSVGPTVAAIDQDQRADLDDITATLTSNLEKIVEYGERAESIVVSMLEHSRGA